MIKDLSSEQQEELKREILDENILDTIEKNEKYNGAIPDKVIQSANQFLSFDYKVYNV